ncbi:hypothetical protein WA158_003074 [Blastocystis sp. Blastoise]
MSQDIFFEGQIYFQTSFLIPNTISLNSVHESLIKASETRFPILRYQFNEERNSYKLVIEEPLFFKSISASSLSEAHELIINRMKTENLTYFFQFFTYIEDDKQYIILNAHHGVADGQMVTSLFCYIYDACMNLNQNKDTRVFSPYDAFQEVDSILFPSNWKNHNIYPVEKPTLEYHDDEINTYLDQLSFDSEHIGYNIHKRIPSDISQRAFTAAKNCSNNQYNCIHGLFLYVCLRSIAMIKHKEEGIVGLTTVVNMRRYMKTNIEEKNPKCPSLCIDSLPITADISSLLQQRITPATLHSLCHLKLNEGQPLLSTLLQKKHIRMDSIPTTNNNTTTNTSIISTPPPQGVHVEISFLGIHPEYCFERSLITQCVNNRNVNLNCISLVIWIDLQGSTHLCGCANSDYYTREGLDSFIDEVIQQIQDFGAI